MKVAILGESSADETAIRILVDAVLGRPTTDPFPQFRKRASGVEYALKIFPNYIRHLHRNTEADGFVIVVDSDKTSLHIPAHESKSASETNCRLCDLWRKRDLVLGELRGRPRPKPLKIAIGLAVPSIEAWFCRIANIHPSEAVWNRALSAKEFPFDARKLKRELYGTERPSIELESAVMAAEATRIASDLPGIITRFPIGFGALQRDLGEW